MKASFVYMMTNRSRVVLLPLALGIVSSDACGFMAIRPSEVSQNATTSTDWFNTRLYYDVRDAIAHEKEIKRWATAGKEKDLVRKLNPKWEDLGKKLFTDRR